jgi:hypothetical protein
MQTENAMLHPHEHTKYWINLQASSLRIIRKDTISTTSSPYSMKKDFHNTYNVIENL